MKIKDLFLNYLCESDENFFHLSEDLVNKITKVEPNKNFDFIRIDFSTTYGKNMSVVTNYEKFMSWYKINKKLTKNPEKLFKQYVSDFLKLSKETEPFIANMNEIVDDNGDIMPSTDLPSNATNSIVGDKIKWDLEKVYRSSTPKGLRYFSGSLGIGIITW